MATTTAMLKEWFERGEADSTVTHMIIKCDMMDMEDYPVYVTDDQDVREVARKNTEKTMEVYAMHLPFETQAKEFRSFHYEYPTFSTGDVD
jgi:hypothetical protein